MLCKQEGGPLKLPSISTRPLFSSLDVGEHSDDLPKLLAVLSSWSAVVDPETNQCYYSNAETNVTTWEKPNELMFVCKKTKESFSWSSFVVE